MQLKLYCEEFQTSLSEFVLSTQNSSALTDVTLVAEDNSQVHTNRLMLSCSSLLFRRILTTRQHTHPMIYLEGVSKQDIENIVNFIFAGELEISQRNLSTFMSVAKDLQITGLIEAFVAEQGQTNRNEKVQYKNTVIPNESMKTKTLSNLTFESKYKRFKPINELYSIPKY